MILRCRDRFSSFLLTLLNLVIVSSCTTQPLSTKGLATGVEQFIGGRSNGEAFGSSVVFMDDMNGDSELELLVGAPNNAERGIDSGCFYLLLSPLANLGSPIRVCGLSGEKLGSAVLNTGDINGDGVADVIAGAPGSPNGAVYIFSGARLLSLAMDSTLSSTDADLTISGQASGISGVNHSSFGSQLAAVDINRDGRLDVAVSDPDAGVVHVFYGGLSLAAFTQDDGLVIFAAAAELKLTQTQGDVDFGRALSHGGDMNGDFGGPTTLLDRFGDDLLVGAPSEDSGRIYLFLGNDGIQGTFSADQYLGAVMIERTVPQFGVALAAAGDLSGDGRDDLAVGFDGGVIVFPGFAEIGLLEGFEITLQADQPQDGFGLSLAGARGQSTTAAAGLIVGASTDSLLGSNLGAVYLFSQASLEGLFNFSSTLFATARATAIFRAEDFVATVSRMLGKSVAYDGDLDGNGFNDIAIGAPEYDEVGLDSGAIFLEF